MTDRDSDVLKVSGLSTGYGRHKVIRNLDLPAFSVGQLHALVGPNAAGKSTLMRALAGLQPAKGSVRLADRELLGLPISEHVRQVGYMPQTLPQGVALNVLESVISAFRASSLDEKELGQLGQMVERRAVAILARVGILRLAMERLDQLSGGQRQLASLAQALVREPRVLLLDEPISALDMQHSFRVMRLVRELARERSIIVLVVLHDLQVAARWCDGIVMLSDGTLAASGSPDEAITPQTLGRVYGVSARIERCSHGTLQIMVDDVPQPS